MKKTQKNIIGGSRFLATACLLLTLSVTSAQTYLTDTFETETTGNQPTAAITVRPNTNTLTNLITVVDGIDNLAGTGKGVRIFDNDVADSAALEYNFVGSAGAQVSAVQISFDFAGGAGNTDGARYINVSAGNFFDGSTSPQFGSSTNRIFDVRLYGDGDVRFYDDGTSTNFVSGAGVNTITMFVNDFETAISYIAPDTSLSTSLAANTVAYYLFDGTDYSTSTGALNAALAGGTENNLGRFGMASLSNTVGLEYIVDNITVSAIPEPGTFALLAGALALTAVMLRRRK